MPLVFTRSGAVHYVRNAEVLAEVLGHSDFDGETLAVGDRVIFEDRNEARLEPVPGESFHVWSEPSSADFENVKRTVGARLNSCDSIMSKTTGTTLDADETEMLRLILSKLAIEKRTGQIGIVHGADRFVSTHVVLKKDGRALLDKLARKVGLAGMTLVDR